MSRWIRLSMLMSLCIIVSKRMGSIGRMWMMMRMLMGDEDTEGIG